jgi:2,4-diketo-3-deoxy-L-fuconate hydrolase
MRLCRYGDNRLGLIEGEVVRDVSHALGQLPTCAYPLPNHDLLIEHLDAVRGAIASTGGGTTFPLSEMRPLSPVANPGKLLAAPVNYRAHMDEALADEANFSRTLIRTTLEAGFFLKATSSLIGAGSEIEIRHPHRRNDHEVELAVIIGKPCRGVSSREALGYVAGYSVGLDLTVRGEEERSLRKSLDTFSVLGPALVTTDEFGDPSGKQLGLSVNGRLRQRANTDDLIMDVPSLIAFASTFYTLHPGDVIFTGTPQGVGPIEPGDRIEAWIEGIGRMIVDVAGGGRVHS